MQPAGRRPIRAAAIEGGYGAADKAEFTAYSPRRTQLARGFSREVQEEVGKRRHSKGHKQVVEVEPGRRVYVCAAWGPAVMQKLRWRQARVFCMQAINSEA